MEYRLREIRKPSFLLTAVTVFASTLAATIAFSALTHAAENGTPGKTAPSAKPECLGDYAHLAEKIWEQSTRSKSLARAFSTMFERPISLEEQRALQEALMTESADEVTYWVNHPGTFSAKERLIIFREMPASRERSNRMMREDTYRFYNFPREPMIGWFQSWDRTLDAAMKDRVLFYSDYERNLFDSFRKINPHYTQRTFAGTAAGDLATKLEKERRFSWLDQPKVDYDNATFVFQNLGKPEMATFNPKFGHVDKDDGSNIFSLRMNPEPTIRSGQIALDSGMNVRLLLCVDAENFVHVVGGYRKISFFDTEGFTEVENAEYEKARKLIADKKIKCKRPVP